MCMKLFGSSKKKESENYEKKYLARYKKQQKANPKNVSKNKIVNTIKLFQKKNRLEQNYSMQIVNLGEKLKKLAKQQKNKEKKTL